MATISRLIVEISSKSEKFKKGIKDSLGRAKDFVKRVGKYMAIAAGLITGALLAAFVKVKSAIDSTADSIDALAKTSRKIGTSVSSLQKLQYQAQLSGVSVSTLNMALQRMVRRVSEAAKGTGEAVKALKELGLDAAELNKLSPDKQFNLIAQAMSKIPNQADKVRLAMKLFDSEGVSLVNTLNSNLAQTSKEFDKLGLAITDQQAKAVEAYNDARTRLSAIWQGFLNQITVQTAPAFTKLIEWITKVIQEMGGMGGVAKVVAGVMISITNGIIKAFSGVLNTIDRIIIALKQAKLAYAELGAIANVVNPLLIARNLITGETPEPFKQKVRLEDEISSIRSRISRRNELTNRATQQTERAKLDITVGANKDAFVEKLKVSGNLDAIIDKAVKGQLTTQARKNDR